MSQGQGSKLGMSGEMEIQENKLFLTRKSIEMLGKTDSPELFLGHQPKQ